VKFSIIIPSYNQGRYIGEALESIRENSENLDPAHSIEAIVMDNCSTDETGSILDEWSTKAGKYEGGKVEKSGTQNLPTFEPSHFSLAFVSESDHGQTDAINKGLKQATGDILAYLCADDFYEPGALKEVARIFEENPEVDVVYGDGYFLEGDSGWKRLKKSGPFSPERLRQLNFVIQPATFWRRSVYEKFGPLDDSLQFCMDNEYWLRIANETRWHYLELPLATARLHSDAKTSSQLVAAWEETAVMAERYGLGGRYRGIARHMRLYGAKWYTAKRLFFRILGKIVGKFESGKA